MENYPQSWLDMNILLPEYWANYLDVHKKLKAGLKSAAFEEQIWSPNFETPRWEKIIYRTIFDEKGEPLKAIGTAVDVTEQKELEAAFRDFQQDQSMRRELRQRGVKSLQVVYSREKPLMPGNQGCGSECICPPGSPRTCAQRRSVPGSISFVPSAAGLIAAGVVVRGLSTDVLSGSHK